jgi:hypothetical protein
LSGNSGETGPAGFSYIPCDRYGFGLAIPCPDTGKQQIPGNRKVTVQQGIGISLIY